MPRAGALAPSVGTDIIAGNGRAGGYGPSLWARLSAGPIHLPAATL
jgi:hypothetical protein